MTEQNTISELQQKANDGDALAQFELALCYTNGIKVEKNTSIANDYLKKSAEQENANAQFAMGLSYFLQSYYFTDENQTEEPYKLAQTLIQKSKVNNLLSILQLVLLHAATVLVMTCDSGNDLAFKWFKKSAKQNNLKAIYWLGQCFRNGIGTEQNDVQAVDCFKNAANQGEVESQCLLAYCFLEGRGIAQSNDRAFKWFKNAAEQGDFEAEYELYRCYFNGSGVKKSEAIALNWLLKAAKKSNVIAQYCLADCYEHGKGVEKSYDCAFEWYEKAADNGHKEAEKWLGKQYFLIGMEYFNGGDVKPDDDRAFLCLNKAVEYGYTGANFNLGLLYDEGRGIEQSDKLAFTCYEKVVEFDDESEFGMSIKMLAHNKLASCYAQGKGVEKNDERAAEHLQYVDINMVHQLASVGLEKIPANNKLVKTVLHIKIERYILNKDYDSAKEYIEQVFENAEDTELSYKHICLITIKQAENLDQQNQILEAKNKELQLKIEQNELLDKALHEKENEMLSFFTHTMRNALATAPESLRQAISLLGGNVYEKDINHYKAINKIAALFSTLSLTDCLIDTFKQSISDPQEFQQSWHMDHRGEATPEWVIASALRQALNRIIFMSDTTELRKLLNSQENSLVKMMRKSFIEEVLPLNVDKQGIDIFYEWSYKNIPSINVLISDTDRLHFGVNQTRFSLLFAITSELILNALKYWDGENRIQISWQLIEEKNYIFSVTNYCNKNASSNLAGTHKGLAFIKRLVELLGDQAEFKCRYEAQVFVAELILNKTLFNEEI